MIYRDVVEDAEAMAAMLECTGGARQVPVLVEAGQVTVGFGGS